MGEAHTRVNVRTWVLLIRCKETEDSSSNEQSYTKQTFVTPSSIQNGRGCKDWRLLTGIYIVWSSSFVFRQSASEKKQAHQIPLTPVPGLLPPLYPLDLASRLF
ncbi:hypothetical protein MJO28_016983 [Puccinia striiformis f. sp. tritici]|nr:hypothetical protein MJO28_016983 [Puccinia striiformis f. sp. tritici]